MKIFYILFLTFLISGCASKVQNVQNYINIENIQDRQFLNSTIDVESSFKKFYSNKMWYTKNNEYQEFAINFWSQNPILMTQEIFLKSGFLDAKQVVKSLYSTKINILEFHQSFEGQKSYAVSNFQVTIWQNNQQKLIHNKIFKYKQVCDENSPKGSLNSFKKNLNTFNTEIIQLLNSI